MRQSQIIELKNVAKNYDGTNAVRDITFSVSEGEIFAILGPSGCGKTTTLRLIAGFEKPDSGKLTINQINVSDSNSFIPPERRNVGIVFQEYALFPHLTVQENVSFGLGRFESSKREKIVENMLGFVGLQNLKDRYPHQLSGGQQQRTALARALAPCPVVLLLDEPFSNLDVDMRVKMRDELKEILRKAKTTAVLVTHDQEEAFVLADRIAVMNDGIIEQIGTPEQIYHSPESKFVADFVGEADFLDGRVTEDGIISEIGIMPNPTNLPIGQAVELMIRPDDIDFNSEPNGECIIETREFKGSENRYHLKLPSGKILHSSQESTVIFKEGTNVTVKASPTHIIVFKKSIEGAINKEENFGKSKDM
ncbi:MAG: ABC transporter ATP-binding protein [Candidatus Hydrothermarchaeaceae archaeon]